ncbi:MAG TPA: hypothetical protein VEF03_10990 [Candidatus Binataceae bacterium]|nr:hypothetical protein [Candidatus Binataceae bacterium]
MDIDPVELRGPWTEGYALERRHALSSEFVGHDSFGNPQFDTKRSELGELIFRLKYRNDKTALDPIADAAVKFINGWGPHFDLVVAVPPSRKRLPYQPVAEIARIIAGRLSKPVNLDAVSKVKGTPELKNVYEYEQRSELLKRAFRVNGNAVAGKRILLVDDLYRSGATAKMVTHDLLAAGAAAVYFLAMTKTRTRA